MTAPLTLLLLGAGGVLNPYTAPVCPPGYTAHGLLPGEAPARARAAHGSFSPVSERSGRP